MEATLIKTVIKKSNFIKDRIKGSKYEILG